MAPPAPLLGCRTAVAGLGARPQGRDTSDSKAQWGSSRDTRDRGAPRPSPPRPPFGDALGAEPGWIEETWQERGLERRPRCTQCSPVGEIAGNPATHCAPRSGDPDTHADTPLAGRFVGSDFPVQTDISNPLCIDYSYPSPALAPRPRSPPASGRRRPSPPGSVRRFWKQLHFPVKM